MHGVVEVISLGVLLRGACLFLFVFILSWRPVFPIFVFSFLHRYLRLPENLWYGGTGVQPPFNPYWVVLPLHSSTAFIVSTLH